MSSISPSNSGTGLTRYTPVNNGGNRSSNTISGAAQATPREQELTQQLDDRLTKRISLLRQHIAPQNSAKPDNTGQTGTQLDILA